MRTKLLEYLVCPTDKQPLELMNPRYEADEIKEGSLKCSGCGREYPVVRFIPRFVDSGQYAEIFGFQWQTFRRVQMDTDTSKKSEESFIEKTGFGQGFVRGKLALDVGVGAGRFADVVSRWGAEVLGIDLSSAVEAAHLNLRKRPNVHLVQADLFHLPFRPESFDIVYSIGVLHHTPDPEAAFQTICTFLKPGGTVAIWLYERWTNSRSKSLTALKKLREYTSRMPAKALYCLTSLAVVLHYAYKIPLIHALKRYVPISPARDWRWRWLDTFDLYHPKFQSYHTYPEVYRWFKGKFAKIELLDEPLSIRGTK